MLNRLWENPRRTLTWIIVLAVLLRVGAALYIGNTIEALPGIFDEVSYHTLALRLLDGHGFSFGEQWWPATAANAPTAHWSFLYTLYLAAVYAIFGEAPLLARVLQAIIVGVAMPWLVYQLALQLFAQRGQQQAEKIGLMAAGITAVYVYLFYYAAALITESFYISTIMASFLLAFRIRQTNSTRWADWLLLGLALGATVLLRQLFLLFVPFLLLWLWWAARPRPWRLLLPLIIIGVMVAPFTLRNSQAFGRFVLLNTNSGYAFFWGNHPRYGTQFIPILGNGEYIEMIPPELLTQGLNEAELESELLSLGVGYVFDDFGRYLQLSLSRIPSYFVFWPSADSSTISNISRVGSFGLFLPFMLAGLVLSLRQGATSWPEWLKTPQALLLLFMLFYTALHLLTWTLIRYRIPIDAILILYAGLALLTLVEKVQR
ncbi:MAG: glycosyltransferase family 39 protein [Candidatus Promineifilaceae bacterium]|nr:glycosyltransferase family 39 protein [Anaerolineaceae bacterium]